MTDRQQNSELRNLLSEGAQEVFARMVAEDWNEMDGITFLREARKQYPTPVVMLTTASSERISEALAAGANGYVAKPFTPEKIGSSLTQVLGL